jgi:CxxC motif-containing protein
MQNIKEIKMECTGCSNYCLLKVQLKDNSVFQIEGNGCKRAFLSVNRQLEKLKAQPPQ